MIMCVKGCLISFMNCKSFCFLLTKKVLCGLDFRLDFSYTIFNCDFNTKGYLGCEFRVDILTSSVKDYYTGRMCLCAYVCKCPCVLTFDALCHQAVSL